MNDVNILAIKPGTISKTDKAKLARANIIVVETDRPEELRLLRPDQDIDGGGLLYAALCGLMKEFGDSGKSVFAVKVWEQVNASRANRN